MIKKIIAASAIGFFLLSGIAFAEATDVAPPADTQTEQAPVDTPADDSPAEAPEADK